MERMRRDESELLGRIESLLLHRSGSRSTQGAGAANAVGLSREVRESTEEREVVGMREELRVRWGGVWI
jgi:hypothetical protein